MVLITELHVGINRTSRKPHRRTKTEHKNLTLYIKGARWFSFRCRILVRKRLHTLYPGWNLTGFAFVKESRV